MPAQRLLPASDILYGLRRQGWSYDDIAAEYGVSKGAVYLQLRQAKAVVKRPSYKHLIPWTVRLDHAHAHPVMMLRLLGRRQKGDDTIPGVKARLLDKWLREVAEADVVLCYDPDYPPNPASPTSGGFYYSRRQPEDGESLTRSDVPTRDALDAEVKLGA